MTPSTTLSVRHRMAKAAVAKAKETRRPDCLPGMAHRYLCGDQVQGKTPGTCTQCGYETVFVAPQVMITDFNNHSAPGQLDRMLLAHRSLREEWSE